MVLNPKTLHVSPQFHVVFDDTFSTVDHMEKGTIPPNWQELVNASENLEPEETTELEKIWSSQTMDEPIEESTSLENTTTPDEAPPTPTKTNQSSSMPDELFMPTMPDLGQRLQIDITLLPSQLIKVLMNLLTIGKLQRKATQLFGLDII